MSSFTLFKAFPPEIQAMVLSACPINDRTCLRLTCKSLYGLFPEKEPVSLSYEDPTSLMCDSQCISQFGPLINGNYTVYVPYRIIQKCHDICYAKEVACRLETEGRPPVQKKCKTKPWLKQHCTCYDGSAPLHYRLKSWMPEGLKYCNECNAFTRRKKQHKGRCMPNPKLNSNQLLTKEGYHGKAKPRTIEKRYWKHHRGRGAFDEGLWKKWYTNAAMNRYENRLARGGDRDGRERYDLRVLKPRMVSTLESRSTNSAVLDLTRYRPCRPRIR
jgi:hypothetical protein